MKGKVVVITGAFGALGRVVANAFADRGARLFLIDKARQPAIDLAPQLPSEAVLLPDVDLSDQAEAARTIGKIQTSSGEIDAFKIDVLVNIAGAFRWQTVADGDGETWDLLYRLNLKTALNMCRAVALLLAKDGTGRIINVGAGAAIRAGAGMGAYAASKAGVHRLTEALAEELKGRATVNAVLPSTIDTAQNRADMPNANFATWVTPEELASVIIFLASDEARAVTGALIPVNGRV